MSHILVTGTSSGIGYAVAKHAIEQGANVFGSVRKAEDGARLRYEFGARFIPLIFDVRDEAAVEQQAGLVRATLNGATLMGLINNAGIAIPGPILHQPTSEVRDQLETNLLSLFWITRAFAPLLGADPALQGPPGRIVNMSSIAGKLGQPFAGAYTTSKHGMEGFSEALRRELMLHDIKVIVVGPALVDTPIWDKLKPVLGRYAQTAYGDPFDRGVEMMIENGHAHGMAASAVAETVWHALTTPHPRLRYSPAQHPVLEQWAARSLPKRLIDWGVERLAGLSPKNRAH